MKSTIKVTDKVTKQNNYQKTNFAKAMNCTVSLLDKIDKLTENIGLDFFNNTLPIDLIGSLGRRFCGRYYNDRTIWVGLHFERPSSYKLIIGFWIPEPETEETHHQEINNLLRAHYNYYAEYREKKENSGYWFYFIMEEGLISKSFSDEQLNSLEEDILSLMASVKKADKKQAEQNMKKRIEIAEEI